MLLIASKAASSGAAGRVITLDDGTRVSIPDDAALGRLREGAEVRISYAEKDGRNEATAIELK